MKNALLAAGGQGYKCNLAMMKKYLKFFGLLAVGLPSWCSCVNDINRKKRFVLFLFVVAQQIVSFAQIKLVDDSYKEKMTASHYVTEPIFIDNSFFVYDGKSRYDSETNIVGDTLFWNNSQKGWYININHKNKHISIEDTIPRGYYLVTDIFIGRDFGAEKVAADIYSLVENGYSFNTKYNGEGYDYGGSQERLKSSLESSGNYQVSLSEMNTRIQECQLKGEKTYIPDGSWCRIESLDSAHVVFTERFRLKKFLPVRYYNLLCNELKGQNVYLTYSDHQNDHYVSPSDRKIKDALTGTTIFQKDSLFRCVDIVVDDDLDTYCILEGVNTGKFATIIEGLRDDKNLYYFSTPDNNITIWKPNNKLYLYSFKKLIRSRYFMAVQGKTELDRDYYRQLIKVDDLNAIYAETKKYQTLTVTQKRQEAVRNKAKQEKHKQELCAKFGNEYGTLIANKKVALGMTPEMCKQSWGTPIQISNMVDSTGKYTVWKYNIKTYIYFHNGVVTKIAN